MRIRVFIDSSALFAATLSVTGYSRDLIRPGIDRRVRLLTSDYVLAEVTYNLAAKQPRAASLLDQFIK